MIVGITARAPGTDAPVEQRFARAPYFVFVDTETGKAESVENPLVNAVGGSAPGRQMFSERGATAAITGQVGGNAARALKEGGIKVYAYRGTGSVADALADCTAGKLSRSLL